ncbi:MAG: hypothetical protein RKR03_02415 [Candidatus Competibacter sp.]|nr:hypothetical protein [Candidatus Competibacter sp.]
MKIQDLFEKWNLAGLKVKTPIMDMEWKPSDPDRDAAWDLYVELLTRITTQSLPKEHGVELTALESVHDLFKITRNTLKEHGRSCIEFTRIAVIVLNQVVRPFTAKWHKLSQNNGFESEELCKEFRSDLEGLQVKLRNYTKLLAELANVEDLTEVEAEQ